MTEMFLWSLKSGFLSRGKLRGGNHGSDAVGSLRGNLLTGCYVCLSRCTIEISRSSRAAGSPLWSLIMSVMSGKKERRIINLQYQNGNILTERVTDVFLRSQKSGLNYVAGVNNRWAVLSLLLLA